MQFHQLSCTSLGSFQGHNGGVFLFVSSLLRQKGIICEEEWQQVIYRWGWDGRWRRKTGFSPIWPKTSNLTTSYGVILTGRSEADKDSEVFFTVTTGSEPYEVNRGHRKMGLVLNGALPVSLPSSVCLWRPRGCRVTLLILHQSVKMDQFFLSISDVQQSAVIKYNQHSVWC